MTGGRLSDTVGIPVCVSPTLLIWMTPRSITAVPSVLGSSNLQAFHPSQTKRGILAGTTQDARHARKQSIGVHPVQDSGATRRRHSGSNRRLHRRWFPRNNALIVFLKPCEVCHLLTLSKRRAPCSVRENLGGSLKMSANHRRVDRLLIQDTWLENLFAFISPCARCVFVQFPFLQQNGVTKSAVSVENVTNFGLSHRSLLLDRASFRRCLNVNEEKRIPQQSAENTGFGWATPARTIRCRCVRTPRVRAVLPPAS